MTIGNALMKHLRELPAAAPLQLRVSDGQLHAALDFLDRDRYSVTMRELTVGRTASAPEDARAFLSACAAAVVRRLSFLEEPLAVWEKSRLVRLRQSVSLSVKLRRSGFIQKRRTQKRRT